MASYQVPRVADRADFIKRLGQLPRAYITQYPWGCEYRPEAYGILGWDDAFLHVYMRCYDKLLRAEIRQDNGDIYTDSCLEFFMNPIPGVRRMFINLEVNPLGYLYLAVGGEVLEERQLLSSAEYDHFGIEIREKPQSGEYWDFCASVPFAFIERVVPEFRKSETMHFTGNFFKCGDETEKPHFGTWSNIEPKTEHPNFYRVDCFGDIDFADQ